MFDSNFSDFGGLVRGCIETKFCKKICVWKLSPRSTQSSPLHCSKITFSAKKLLEICKKIFFSFFFLFFFFFSFLRRSAPAGGDWGYASPLSLPKALPETSFLEEWLEKAETGKLSGVTVAEKKMPPFRFFLLFFSLYYFVKCVPVALATFASDT